jgi:cobalamin biosynthesis Mg chelatase CobN
MKQIAIILLFATMFAACRSRLEVEQRSMQQTVAVQSVEASTIAAAVDRWEETIIREVVIMQADSTGALHETARVTATEKRQGEREQKTEENTQKVDSTAFSSESEVIYKETKEDAGERPKTRFWRNTFFYLVLLAAIVVLVVLLWRKTLGKWI